MLGRLDVLRIVSSKLGRHTVRIQGVDVCRCSVKIETSRRLICAINFIWSQSQLGHPKELIIQRSGLKLWEIVSRDLSKIPTSQRLTELYFGAVFTSVKLRNPRWYQRLNELRNWQRAFSIPFCSNFSKYCIFLMKYITGTVSTFHT